MYSIGIDIGATNTDIGLVRMDGTIIGRENLPSQSFDKAEIYISAIIDKIRQLLANNDVQDLDGIGIGAPNGNYRTGCIEANTANLRMKERIPLGTALEEAFHTNVKLDNDANAAALGEMVYGGAKGMQNFIMLTLGTGVGSGIVIDGKLLHGANGAAGELGHAIVNPNGRLCGCGRRGCIEMYASARGICQNYREEVLKGDFPCSLTKEGLDAITCQYVGESASKGDKIAQRAYDTTAYWLGIALANAAAFSEPEAIFLMGGPTRAGEALMRPLQKYFEENLLFLYKGKIKLQFSQLKSNETAILGAAALSSSI